MTHTQPSAFRPGAFDSDHPAVDDGGPRHYLSIMHSNNNNNNSTNVYRVYCSCQNLSTRSDYDLPETIVTKYMGYPIVSDMHKSLKSSTQQCTTPLRV